MRKTILTVCWILLILTAAFSQSPQSWNSAEMYQALRKLNVLGSVLYVAAHPDDENTRLIAYLSKDRLYRTGYLSMTRGDGGQNLIGEEQGIELGLIRTQELLAARRIDGGEQFFTRAYDFGFSKSPEETFTKWDKEKILSDAVWVIRKFQPDVIITRFPVTGEGGHGHHTASAILANEAFSAAADPTRFPEQLKYVQPWQAKRILWNTFNFGGTNTTRDDQYKLDVGGYNPLLGKSYGEIAAESRSQHKSQGFGVPATRGEALEYFKATQGNQPVNNLMEGIDLSWKRVNGGEAIEKMVDSLSAAFDFLHPEKSVKGLVALFQQMEKMPESYWRNQKFRELYQLIEQCSGLFLDATTAQQFAVQGDSVKINFSFNNRLGVNVSIVKVSAIAADRFDSSFIQALSKNRNHNFSKTVYVHPGSVITQPYWLANKMEEGYFNVKDQQDIGKPDVEPTYWMIASLKIEGQEFNFWKPVKYKFTDPVRGELYEPLVVIPSYSLKINPELGILGVVPKVQYDMTFSSFKNNNLIKAYRTPGIGLIDSFLLKKGDVKVIPFSEELDWGPVYDSKNSKQVVNNLSLNYEYTFRDKITNRPLFEFRNIKYDHIPAIVYFKDSRVVIKNFDLKTYNKKIGYITGAGDKVPEALEQMGYEVTLLGDKELSKNSLDKFDAIITGVRAYNTNEWMSKYYDKLMKYVNEGGNLIVQYNTSNNIGPVRAKIDPYNLTITRNRVTDENAKVTLLKPEYPVFNFPNKITDDDFKGWIQERSIYHGSDTSGKFEKLIGMSDPGEKSDDGSLLVARYGKGWFTYTGLVFFRELPAGVPGAYRLLANLIALNKKKGF
jgi:LmbE family N-acetylglucosaminyl deacetylase